MRVFSESSCAFTFDKRWKVLKYDDHRYYQIVSGRSFSGIDFAAILNNEELFLIEVKNFYQYENKGQIEDVDEFVIEIREKVLDTIDLVNIIFKYHQRSWSYKTFIKLVNRFPCIHFNWWFWTRMQTLMSQKAFTFVLLIESVVSEKILLNKIQESIAVEGYQMPRISVRTFAEAQIPGLEIFKL